jgi:acyl carrier protein
VNREQIIEHIRVALSIVLNRELADLDQDVRLFEDLALDSTSVIELLMALEDTIGLEIDPDELEPNVFYNVASLADYVGARVPGAAVP